MKSLWRDSEAQQCKNSLELRAYSSRLLGQYDDLVLHGGGNTSAKDRADNVFGETEDILHIKGSGHDLKTIGTDGFAATRLQTSAENISNANSTSTRSADGVENVAYQPRRIEQTSLSGGGVEARPVPVLPSTTTVRRSTKSC